MYVLGPTEAGRKIQAAVQDDPRFHEVIAVEQEGTIVLYQCARRHGESDWATVHIAWARIAPIGPNTFRLSHQTLSGTWLELDVEGDLLRCVYGIMNNVYHLFFG